MTEVCAVDLRVELPRTIAAEVEQAKRQDPDVLSRILTYGMARRAIFDHLTHRAAYGVQRVERET
ncbi:MAG: hypothetical protein P8174_00550 [Gemmatimonadota bacterium]|jgi:hypothetical protein